MSNVHNKKLREVLLEIKISIGKRKQLFKEKGNNLDCDPDFLALQTKLTPLLKAFNQALEPSDKSDRIVAVESDVCVFDDLQKYLKSATDTVKFKGLYKSLIDRIEDRLSDRFLL